MKTTDLAAKHPCCQGPQGAVDRLEQSRAWPEIGNALGGNLNLAAGLWIASDASSALTGGKGAEP